MQVTQKSQKSGNRNVPCSGVSAERRRLSEKFAALCRDAATRHVPVSAFLRFLRDLHFEFLFSLYNGGKAYGKVFRENQNLSEE